MISITLVILIIICLMIEGYTLGEGLEYLRVCSSSSSSSDSTSPEDPNLRDGE